MLAALITLAYFSTSSVAFEARCWFAAETAAARLRPDQQAAMRDLFPLASSLISRPVSNEPNRVHRGHTPENRHPPLEVESEKGEMAE